MGPGWPARLLPRQLGHAACLHLLLGGHMARLRRLKEGITELHARGSTAAVCRCGREWRCRAEGEVRDALRQRIRRWRRGCCGDQPIGRDQDPPPSAGLLQQGCDGRQGAQVQHRARDGQGHHPRRGLGRPQQGCRPADAVQQPDQRAHVRALRDSEEVRKDRLGRRRLNVLKNCDIPVHRQRPLPRLHVVEHAHCVAELSVVTLVAICRRAGALLLAVLLLSLILQVVFVVR
mmetsp:Transcript_16687/g.65191  ORF Transcript_16687/g.65191 Transcript_16687/m.65191 type:complete len:233 (-) Transcript_16687:965-1663(-)